MENFQLDANKGRKYDFPPDRVEAARRQAMGEVKLADLIFEAAAPQWLEGRLMYLQARTVRDYKEYIKTLTLVLKGKTLREVHIGYVKEFQRFRNESGVSHTRINHEVSCLGQIMQEARLWHKIKPYYKALPVRDEGPGKALLEAEVMKILAVAKKKKKWEVALLCAMVSVNTGAGPGEIRHLRLGDINLDERMIYIKKGVKNRYRVRPLELNPIALYAMQKLYARAEAKGAPGLEAYLVPHRAPAGQVGYDFSRPQGHWYRAWNAIKKAAGLPNFRFYDLRHTCATWLSKNPQVSKQTVVEIMGWRDDRQLRRYSHHDSSTRRTALDQLDSGKVVEMFDNA